MNLVYVHCGKDGTWKGHVSGAELPIRYRSCRMTQAMNCSWVRCSAAHWRQVGLCLGWDAAPPPARERGEQPKHQLVLCSAEWEGRVCTVKIAVAWGDAHWHAESQIILPVACQNLQKINFPSEPSSGGTFNQSDEFKSHYMKRSKRAKLNTSSTKTQCFEWSSQEARSKLSWQGILPYTEL